MAGVCVHVRVGDSSGVWTAGAYRQLRLHDSGLGGCKDVTTLPGLCVASFFFFLFFFAPFPPFSVVPPSPLFAYVTTVPPLLVSHMYGRISHVFFLSSSRVGLAFGAFIAALVFMLTYEDGVRIYAPTLRSGAYVRG